MSGFEVGAGINDIVKIADALYKVATALRSGPAGASNRMANLRTESGQIEQAQLQCLKLARKVGDDMVEFSRALQQTSSKVNATACEQELIRCLDEYKKTQEDCRQFFDRYWTFSEGNRRFSFAKGWDALKWVHHAEDELKNLRDDLNSHRARIMFVLQRLTITVASATQ
jgi:hypothetical protein